jgi:ABC-type lipoprotein release transport system permease subunit
VMALVLRRGLLLTATGVAAGVVIALGATAIVDHATPSVVSRVLFGIEPFDPTSYAVVCAAVSVVALAAHYLPLRTAARLDPLASLRVD